MRLVVLLLFITAACSSSMPPAAPAAAAPPAATADAPREAGSARAQPGPWGEPVSSPVAEAHVRDGLHALAIGSDPQAHFGDGLVIGPGLWIQLAADARIADKGVPSQVLIPGSEQALEARTFAASQRPGRQVKDIVGSDALRAVARIFDGAPPRPATALERQTMYLQIPHEIAGEPMTVVEAQGQSLGVLHDDQGKLFWIELLSAWGTRDAAEK